MSSRYNLICMVTQQRKSSIAQPYYTHIPDEIIEKMNALLPEEFRIIINVLTLDTITLIVELEYAIEQPLKTFI